MSALLEDAWFREEPFESGGNPGRPVEEFIKAIPLLLVESEDRAIGEDSLGLLNGRRADELAELLVRFVGRLAYDEIVVLGNSEVPP